MIDPAFVPPMKGFRMKHQKISFVKSGVRIVGYFVLGIIHPVVASILITSEVIGIVEEFGHE
jgi:hypothetical protein